MAGGKCRLTQQAETSLYRGSDVVHAGQLPMMGSGRARALKVLLCVVLLSRYFCVLCVLARYFSQSLFVGGVKGCPYYIARLTGEGEQVTVEGQGPVGPLDAASGAVKYRIQHIFEIGDTPGRDAPSVRGIWANLAVSLALRACPLYHTLSPSPGPSAASTQASGGKSGVPDAMNAEDFEQVNPGGDGAFPTDAGCAHGVNGGRCVCWRATRALHR